MKFNGMMSTSPPPHLDDDAVIARLTELDVFAGASSDELRKIARSGTALSIPEGWSLIWEKTPADKAYVVLDGTASVHHDHTEVAKIGAGEFIGEMALVTHRLRSATVVATTPLWVLHFTRDSVERLRSEVPAFRQEVELSTETRSA